MMKLKLNSNKRKPMKTIRLRAILEIRQLSQQDLADLTGISLRTVSRYVNGESVPDVDAIALIAKALDCSVDYLLSLTNEINGYITEKDLTPMERRLLNAYRNSKNRDEKLRNLIRAIASDEDLMAEPDK